MAKISIRDMGDSWLCQDCTHYVVNGELPENSDTQKLLEERWSEWSNVGTHFMPNWDAEDEDGIEHFSKSQCDYCKSFLAGSRHRFATWHELEGYVGP